MSQVRIVVNKKLKQLLIFREGNQRPIYSAPITHGGKRTKPGVRTIKRWVWGPCAPQRRDIGANAWFPYEDPFKGWPAPGQTGFISVAGRRYKVKRESLDEGWVFREELVGENQFDWVWKHGNPYGELMADLDPGGIELHGTSWTMPKKKASDPPHVEKLPAETDGCIRTYNTNIKMIKSLAPDGTKVYIVEK